MCASFSPMPKVKPRRPYYDGVHDGYMESLDDWYKNNWPAVEWFLKNAEAIRGALQQSRKIRRAVADYMGSEGCTCCQDVEAHRAAQKVLAKLLKVPMYSDKSGWNFAKFRTGAAKGA